MPAYNFQRQFVHPIALGLGIDCPKGFEQTGIVVPKTHTIRGEGKRRHARPGEIISLYWGQRTKHCMKIGEAVCKSSAPIAIHFSSKPGIEIGGDVGLLISGAKYLDDFAHSDGFADWPEMVKFWKDVNDAGDEWIGRMISWRPR